MPERQILSLDEFTRKALAARKGLGPAVPPPGDFIIRSPVTAAAQPAAGDDRRIPFAVATAATNRNRWQMNPQGWEFANYLNNPVMLWAHDDTKLPVAKAEKVWVDGNVLKVVALFTPAGFSGFNDAVFECYQQKFLNAVSAGWIPLEYEFVEDADGWHIICSRQELVEISFVPVPAEPNALRLAAGAGIDVGELRKWAAAVLGDDRRYVVYVPAASTADEIQHTRKVVEEWHPGAKVLVMTDDSKLVPVDPLAAAFQVEASVFDSPDPAPGGAEQPSVPAGTPAAETNSTVSTIAVSSTSPAAGASAAVGSDAPGERLIPGSREWRTRQLAHDQ